MKTVLIVEDDLDIRNCLMELLTDVGFETVAAENGAVALELLRNGSLPQLILLDLMMPVMDGFAFREEQLKDAAIAKVPVVVMSADGNILDKRSRTQADAYLKKPVDIHELISIVTETI